MRRTVLLRRMALGCILLAGLSLIFASCGKKDAAPKSQSAAVLNATGLPIVKSPVTLSFQGIQMNSTRVGRWDETDLLKSIAEKTGVQIVWDGIPQASWKEKKNLTIASRELPDGFMASMSLSMDEISTLGAEGVLIPLEGLIDQYAPHVKSLMAEYPTYEPSIRSPDGHIYAVAGLEDLGFDSFSAAIIRQDWLDKLGLKMPTTTEEFYNVLKTFKDKDASGTGKTIPFSFLYKESDMLNREVKREFEWMFLPFGVADNPIHIFIEDNGEVVFTADKPGFRDAISYIHRLYAEKLIDVEIFTQDRTLLTNKIRQNNVGVYTDYRLKLSMAAPESESLYTLMPPLKGPNGDQRWLRAQIGITDGAFAITSACKYPEVAMRWLDYINEEDNNIQFRYGMFKEAGWTANEALVPSKDKPGLWEVNVRPTAIPPNDWPFSAPVAVSPVLSPRRLIDKYVAEKGSNLAKNEVCDFYRPYLTKNPYNYPWRFTVEELEELSLLQTELVAFVEKTQAQWIDAGGVEQGWDAYLQQLKRYNVDRYLELYKKAYQRSLVK
ncbi:sugar ABC transporter substrate-binding protein [Spirochaetia bacterium]|nr:sugar ABC transporter substrate-binding protein [Spirochaetia bacterium]